MDKILESGYDRLNPLEPQAGMELNKPNEPNKLNKLDELNKPNKLRQADSCFF